MVEDNGKIVTDTITHIYRWDKFNKGDIIWNLSTNQLQLWNGKEWVDLYSGNEKGVQAVSQIGNITVATGGDTSIEIGLN